MTPKEKAKELVIKTNSVLKVKIYQNRINEAKQCALIAVDEIINETSLGLLLIEWWSEVKKEIELL